MQPVQSNNNLEKNSKSKLSFFSCNLFQFNFFFFFCDLKSYPKESTNTLFSTAIKTKLIDSTLSCRNWKTIYCKKMMLFLAFLTTDVCKMILDEIVLHPKKKKTIEIFIDESFIIIIMRLSNSLVKINKKKIFKNIYSKRYPSRFHQIILNPSTCKAFKHVKKSK